MPKPGGYLSWTGSVAVSDDAATVTVDVPELRALAIPAAAASSAPVGAPPTAPASQSMTPPARHPLVLALPTPAAASDPEVCHDDGNPRREWAWIDGTLGGGYSTMASLNSSDFAAKNTSGGGPVFGAGVGIRVSFFSLGVRARDVVLDNLSVWELDAETALQVHVADAVVYFGLRGGYAFGSVSRDASHASSASVTGFNVGTMLGFDHYLTRALSWGLEANPELLDLQRPPLPLPAGLATSMLTPEQRGLYKFSGLSVGLVFVGSAHLGIHF